MSTADLHSRYAGSIAPQAPTGDPLDQFDFAVSKEDEILIDAINDNSAFQQEWEGEIDVNNLTELRFRLTELGNDVNTALAELRAYEARWRSWKHQPWKFNEGMATILEERTAISQWKGDVDLATQRVNARIKVMNESRTPYAEVVAHLQDALARETRAAEIIVEAINANQVDGNAGQAGAVHYSLMDALALLQPQTNDETS